MADFSDLSMPDPASLALWARLVIALGLEKRFVFESWFYPAILNTFWR